VAFLTSILFDLLVQRSTGHVMLSHESLTGVSLSKGGIGVALLCMHADSERNVCMSIDGNCASFNNIRATILEVKYITLRFFSLSESCCMFL